MAKILLELPSRAAPPAALDARVACVLRRVPFTSSIVVAEADIDELGHASNIAYVRWIQEIALAHSTAVGLDLAAYRKLGGLFFVRRHEIDYMRPVLRGDALEVRTWIDSASAAKCHRATEILNRSGTVVLRAMTVWGFVDAVTGRPIRIPDSIRSAFGMLTSAKSTPDV